MECTKMKTNDRLHYDQVFKSTPVEICGRIFSSLSRPRWWWFSDDVAWPDNLAWRTQDDGLNILTSAPEEIVLTADEALTPGWSPVDSAGTAVFSCLTASPHSYQNVPSNCVRNLTGTVRRLYVSEEERMMGFPENWTWPIVGDTDGTTDAIQARRRKLLGNTWHVGVAVFILRHYVQPRLMYDSPVGARASGDTSAPMGTLVPSIWLPPRPSCIAALLPKAMQYQDEQTRATFEAAPATLCKMWAEHACYRPMPPSWAELNSFTAALCVDLVQPRKCTWPSGWPAMLPIGLKPLEHIEAAISLPPPNSKLQDLPTDLAFAIQRSAELWNIYGTGAKLRKWRRLRMNNLKQMLGSIESFGKDMNKQRSSTSRTASGHRPKFAACAAETMVIVG
jgi:hypothetical protein